MTKTPEDVAKLRHGKPSKAYRSSLKAPRRSDWDRMVRACVEAVLSGSTHVLVMLPYTFKLPKDFPPRMIVKKEGYVNTHRIRASWLLEWLYEKGHSSINMEALRRAQISFTRTMGRLEGLEYDKVWIDELEEEDAGK